MENVIKASINNNVEKVIALSLIKLQILYLYGATKLASNFLLQQIIWQAVKDQDFVVVWKCCRILDQCTFFKTFKGGSKVYRSPQT